MLGDKAWLAVRDPVQKCDTIEVRALCRSENFVHTKLKKKKRFLYGPHFVHGGIVMLI